MEKLKIAITGADGFIGKNLYTHLISKNSFEIRKITRDNSLEELSSLLDDIDIVFHLAGVNRPLDNTEFKVVNIDFTDALLSVLKCSTKSVKLIVSSSTQTSLDNAYGKSKLESEKLISDAVQGTLIEATIYRLPGVFGKWSKPNYNSVVATFCYNVANDLPLEVRDSEYALPLVYIDDVVDAFEKHIYREYRVGGNLYNSIPIQFNTTLGELATIIKEFKNGRESLYAPRVRNIFIKNLYSTYLSFLPENAFSYPMELKVDARGDLFEWIKSLDFGQIFVSTTKPGITRGNHYHHTKTEKFLVIRGVAEIKLRKIDKKDVITYAVDGITPTVVDIPPGYTHCITNVGNTELITLFWANEVFDPQKTDTFFLKVEEDES